MTDLGAGASGLPAALSRRRRELGITLAELAGATGIDRHRLQRLLTGSGAHIHLDEVARLSDALALPPGDAMQLIWPGRRLLDPQPAASEPVADRLDPEQAPTAALTRLLTRSPHWSFSMSRVSGGPAPEVQVPILNSFAVVPAPAEAPLPDHVTLRGRFHAEFGALPPGVSFAIWQGERSVPERFPFDPDGGHPSTRRPHALYLHSAVYAADRPAGDLPVRLRGAAADGVVVVALRAIGKPLHVAATVARALGWALVSTYRAGMRLAAPVVPDPRVNTRTQLRYRNLMLGEFLAAASPVTVVSHTGTPPRDGTGWAAHALVARADAPAPFVVLLRESDDLLAASLRRPVNSRGDPSTLTLAELTGWRDQVEERVLALQEAGRGLVVRIPDGWLGRSAEPAGEDELHWRAHGQVARRIVHDLLHQSGLRSGFAVRDPLARALLAHGSPLSWA